MTLPDTHTITVSLARLRPTESERGTNSMAVQGVCPGSGLIVDETHRSGTGRSRGRCPVCQHLHWRNAATGALPNHTPNQP